MGSCKQTLRELAEQGLAFTEALCAKRDAVAGTLDQRQKEQKANELHVAHRQKCHDILKRLEEFEAARESPEAAPEPVAVSVPQAVTAAEPEPEVQTSRLLPLGSLFGEFDAPALSPGVGALIQ